MKRYSSDKDWNVYLNCLVKFGWVYKRCSKHGRLTHPNGSRSITVPCSPSDRNSLKKFRAQIKKMH